MDFKHTEGGPKYLQRAVEEVRPRAGDIMLNIARSVLLAGKPLPPLTGAPKTPNEGPKEPKTGAKKKSLKKRRRKVLR
jgi:hypothetical protein